jgi:hypothetical protein
MVTLKPRVEIDTEEATALTDASHNILYDAAMYFAAAMMHLHPSLKLYQETRRKSLAHFGSVVLAGFRSGVVLDPHQIMKVYGDKVSEGVPAEREMVRLLGVWRKLIDSKPPKGR